MSAFGHLADIAKLFRGCPKALLRPILKGDVFWYPGDIFRNAVTNFGNPLKLSEKFAEDQVNCIISKLKLIHQLLALLAQPLQFI